MGFATALSGLKAASTNLQVTGNNIANSQTVGFKESRAEFADVYASSIGGVSKTQPGSGVKVTEVAQQFAQGNIENTQNSLDLAISGNGFFVLADNVNLPDPNNPTAPVDPSVPSAYTRNGAFQLNSVGNVVNDKGQYLLAFAPNGTTAAEGFSAGVFRPLTLDAVQGLPVSTKNINMKLNINGGASLPTAAPFDPTNPQSYNNTTSITTYDIQGNAHIASTYYVKTATANVWDAYLFLDDYGITTGGQAALPIVAPPSTVVGLNAPGLPMTMTFTAAGALDQVGGVAIAAAAGKSGIAATATTAASAPLATPADVQNAVEAATGAANASSIAGAAAGVAAAALVGATAGSVLTAVNGAAGAGSAVRAAAASAAALTGATAASVAAAANAAVAVDAAALAAATAAEAIVGSTAASVAAAVSAAAPVTHVSKVDFGAINLSAIDPLISVEPMAFDIDYFGTTQFATPFSVNGLDQDGLPTGNLTGIDVDGKGVVFARYSNGGSKALGQVALARFQSNQSLSKLGDTSWAQTSSSGAPIYGAAGDNNFGGIQSSALEGSNVDLSDQLVRLIIAQQAYQANSQTITTEKTLIQTILNA
jgi:flagellar hook protein FlgE